MIIRNNTIPVDDIDIINQLESEIGEIRPEEIIFFDLEHYVYKKPKCIGVFGACVYKKETNSLLVTQYMIEGKDELVLILKMARDFFINMKEVGKTTITTFSGNNDFTVINYLFNKYYIKYDFTKEYKSIDIQKEYERAKNTSIGLKNLEKIFEIYREGELISGSNLAKTFHKILKDKDYIQRMPKEKVENILLYNEQDVVNLFRIYVKWNEYIKDKEVTEVNQQEDESLDKFIEIDKLEQFEVN